MAIERFEKVEIISHISSKERLIEELQAKGLVEIIDISAHKREPGANGDVSERIERVEFLLNTLEGYTEKGGMFGGLFQEKVSVSEAELGKVVDSLDIQKVYEGCRSLVKRLERLNSEESNLSLIGESILPWRDLRLSCMELEGTVRVGLAVGTIASRGFSSFEKEIGKMPGVFIKVISRGRALTHCLLGFMRADEPDISAAFARLGFQTETLPPVPDELAALKFEQCLLKINARLAELRSERNSLNKQMRELTPLLPSARVVYDYLCSLRHREKVDELFGKTETTFTICGWVRRRDIKSLRRLIGERFQEAEIGIKKIKDSDIPPTSLQNNRLVKPFEAVVDLYGLPNSRELDPTPLLAPFFVLFFGLCLTDAGYGAVLSILSWLGLRKFKGLMVRKLLRLLFLSGIVTIFLGLLTGGVFGLEFKAAKFFMLIDPMKDFLVFLLVSIGIGFIQVWYGFLINMLK